MLIVIPYPNNKVYTTMIDVDQDELHTMRKHILDYVDMVCSGPWESDELDVLHNGIRVRLGRQQDYFMLKLKYGSAEKYR